MLLFGFSPIFFLFRCFCCQCWLRIVVIIFWIYHFLMKSMTFIAAPFFNYRKLARFTCLLSFLLQSKRVFALITVRFIQVGINNTSSLYSYIVCWLGERLVPFEWLNFLFQQYHQQNRPWQKISKSLRTCYVKLFYFVSLLRIFVSLGYLEFSGLYSTLNWSQWAAKCNLNSLPWSWDIPGLEVTTQPSFIDNEANASKCLTKDLISGQFVAHCNYGRVSFHFLIYPKLGLPWWHTSICSCY